MFVPTGNRVELPPSFALLVEHGPAAGSEGSKAALIIAVASERDRARVPACC